MSLNQNLGYSVIQVLHNFGAVATVAGSVAALKLRNQAVRKKLSGLVLAGWTTQGLTGAGFGAVSYYYYRQFPDISGIAVDALFIKMACTVSGFSMMSACRLRGDNWQLATQDKVWLVAVVISLIALSSAAVLRWFS